MNEHVLITRRLVRNLEQTAAIADSASLSTIVCVSKLLDLGRAELRYLSNRLRGHAFTKQIQRHLFSHFPATLVHILPNALAHVLVRARSLRLIEPSVVPRVFWLSHSTHLPM